MAKRPRCPDCGGNLGVRVCYSTSRVYAMVPDTVVGTFRRGERVLRRAYTPEQDEVADETVCCLNPGCIYDGGDIIEFRIGAELGPKCSRHGYLKAACGPSCNQAEPKGG